MKTVQVTLDLDIPEGYEQAEGKQPRYPKKGEEYTTVSGGHFIAECNIEAKYIILKKKEPKYAVRFIDTDDCVWLGPDQKIREGRTYIEMKAVSDLNRIIENIRYRYGCKELSKFLLDQELETYQAIEEILHET